MGLQTISSFVWTPGVFWHTAFWSFFSQPCGCFHLMHRSFFSERLKGTSMWFSKATSMCSSLFTHIPTCQSNWRCSWTWISVSSAHWDRQVLCGSPHSPLWSVNYLQTVNQCNYGAHFVYFLSGSQSCVSCCLMPCSLQWEHNFLIVKHSW